MRRPFALAAAAAILLGALIPAQALAGTIWSLDQSAEPGPGYFNVHVPHSTQTVTAGVDGVLTMVELYCRPGFSKWATVDVTLTIDSISASGTCPLDPGWTTFEFNGPNPTPVKGQQYTIDIGIAPGDEVGLYMANVDYPGGQGISGDTGVGDFAFRTYVLPSPTTTYKWSKTSVTAGSSTSVTLVTTTEFPEMNELLVVPDVGFPIGYKLQLGTLPAWFDPTGLKCSKAIAPANCTLAKYKAGLDVALAGEAGTVTVSITGTANPPLGSSDGAATGSSCTYFGLGDDAINACSDAGARLAVVAPAATPTPTAPPAAPPTAAPTPPPTTTATSPDSMSGPLPLSLAAGLCFLLGSLFVARRRRAVR